MPFSADSSARLSTNAAARPELSVILPIYNEEGNIIPLVDEIAAALTPLGRSFEVLCVDDKSKDGGLAEMRALAQERTYVRVIEHRINCGQSAGVASGFQFSRGDFVIVLDSDGQNDPADIPRLLAEMRPGVHCCCGIRAKRRDDWVKRVSSKIGNGFRKLLTGGTVTDAGCALKVIRRECLAEIPAFNGMHRWAATMLQHQGYTVTEIPINHRERIRGVSKYGIGNRALRGLRDCFAMRWFRARAVVGDRFGHVDA